MVTDAAGVCIAVSAHNDIQIIRRALDAGMHRQDTQPVKISRLARGVLGTQPLPAWVSALWGLASVEAPVLIMLGRAFTVLALAGK